MIKSFRGLMQADTQQRIKLSTNQGLVGYKIHNFQILGNTPGTAELEAVVKIYKQKQDSNTSTVNFDDPLLLAVAEHREFAAAEDYSSPQIIIFDNEIFNQDIYVTYKTAAGTMAINYHIELEQLKLDIHEATVATLKDMRGRA